MEHPSLQELCYGNLKGGLLCWGSGRICGGALWRQASLSMGTPLGSREGDSFTRDLCVEKGSGDGHLSPQRPRWEPGVVRLPGTLRGF